VTERQIILSWYSKVRTYCLNPGLFKVFFLRQILFRNAKCTSKGLKFNFTKKAPAHLPGLSDFLFSITTEVTKPQFLLTTRTGKKSPGSFAGAYRNFLCSGFRVITKPHAFQELECFQKVKKDIWRIAIKHLQAQK